MLNQDIVITNIETLLPFAASFDGLQATLSNATKPVYAALQFADGQKQVQRIPNAWITDAFPARKRKKQDLFSLYAQLAVSKLLKTTKLQTEDRSTADIGIFIGNCTGGWSYVEPQLIDMYQHGMDRINSYVATAWFPTAAQGEISIAHGIKGYSKTICGDRLSGGFAIEHAIQAIEQNMCQTAIAGGVEAPLTPLVYNALGIEDLSEGAVFTLIERMETATARGAKPLARILGFYAAADPDAVLETVFDRPVQEQCDFVYNHKLSSAESQQIALSFQKHQDRMQHASALHNVFDSGELLAGEVPFALATILTVMREQTGKRVLINTSDQDGQFLSIYLEIL